MGRLLAMVVVMAALSGCGGSSSSSAGVTFDPATLSCSNPAGQTTTIKLPSSVADGTQIDVTLDAHNQVATVSTATGFTHASDGSWTTSNAFTIDDARTLCQMGGGPIGNAPLAAGTHTMQVLDHKTGAVLATGSYTVTN